MKRILLLIILCSCINATFAQTKPKHKARKFDIESFKKKKADFIISEAGLTPSEASVFIPMMDELLQKKFELNRKVRKEARLLKNNQKASSDDYERYLSLVLESGIKEAELNKEYYQKFRKVLSPEKIYKYKEAETLFLKETINKELKPQ